MTRRQVELALALWGVIGCGGGITDRTVAEAGAEAGPAGGSGPLAGGGNAAAGTKATGGKGSGGTPGVGGAPVVDQECPALPNPAPLRALSAWEYARSLLALTGVPASEAFPEGPKLERPFVYAMAWDLPRLQQLFVEAERQGLAARDGKLLPCDIAKPFDATCATAFVDAFVGRVVRRPLSDAERARYVALFELGSGNGDMASGVELVVEAALLSPLFLHKFYLGEPTASGSGTTPLTPFEVAGRLSYLLAGSTPDDALLQAASNGELLTGESVEAQARRLLAKPDFTQVAQHFHSQWLGLDELDGLVSVELPKALLDSMRHETESFIGHVFQGTRRLPDLLQLPTSYLDQRLALHYGVSPPAQDWLPVELDPTRSFGVLTKGSTLVRFNNPTQRGNFVRERLLCESVPPPPPSVVTTIVIAPGQTRREAWAEHEADPACAACHQLLDPIGFGFENFDELGRFRSTDNGLAVDASGMIAPSGEQFVGPEELASLLSQRPGVGTCLTQTWLGYALQRATSEGDDCTVKAADTAFAAANLDVAELLVALVKSLRFRTREAHIAVPEVPAPQLVPGPTDTLAQRRQLLLAFTLDEARWLRQPATQDDGVVLDQYMTSLRELDVQLSQLSQAGLPP